MIRLLTLILLCSIQCSAQDSLIPPKVDLVNDIFDFPDKEAEFPGGIESIQSWVNFNIYYPQEAIKNREEGLVLISCIVEAKGNISNIRIEKGVSPSIDRAAKRSLCCIPRWIPGEVNHQAVRSRIIVPIKFELQ
jgi:periplasmic protein TonB